MPMRPAAYIRIVSRPGAPSPARQREAIIEVARERGWPEPVVYADDGRATADGYGPALAMLSAAVGAGRHDMVIMSGPGVISRSPAHLMAFLFRCNHHGVAVEFVSPATAADAFLMRPPAAPQRPPPLRCLPWVGRPTPPNPVRRAAGTADVLTSAGVEALTRSFPDWRIWADVHGWHGRRRSNVYVQIYQRGAPAFCVHGVSALDLAAQLRWQQAADAHAPAGCSRR
jgi:hypothetical protein